MGSLPNLALPQEMPLTTLEKALGETLALFLAWDALILYRDLEAGCRKGEHGPVASLCQLFFQVLTQPKWCP